MGRLVEYILLLLSVVLVVSTLTGSTNNYYNEPTGNKGFTDCCVNTKFAEFTNLSLTPNPLIRGKECEMQGIFHNTKTIQWGILHVTITYTFKNYINITFVDEKFNLCDYFVDLFKIQCPLPPGIYHDDSVRTVPNIFWPGRYYGKVTAYNEEGEEMMCISKEFTVK
ncbi:PREDICTED: phosphatidylglycerol/phosphatidylinositol transfer protein-like [Amphimedon queenslandica]|uniref:MD-2-related lipid-recognition domain-containing protein n=1 Tax=Amphimedon queenslandica TaxID=400682 RepID=A0AAN0JNX2_AMPQE|nr:PREDICTED: phosphatidylglycerol/phosphatidylinositol transfer protein-like [Amphimedon queenslandica]|eukprot:XP_019858523.1 PREDICTED: phosphatidylglycerol/phosphatidylinositol transfer protein-like [Amphimedon queenslandica]